MRIVLQIKWLFRYSSSFFRIKQLGYLWLGVMPFVGYSLPSLGATYTNAHSMTPSLSERVAKLERMAQNPVLLQLIQRMERQEQEMQAIQDRLDRLERKVANLNQTVKKTYAEEDERFSHLEKEVANLKSALDKNASGFLEEPTSRMEGAALPALTTQEKVESMSSATPTKVLGAVTLAKEPAKESVKEATKIAPNEQDVSRLAANKENAPVKTHFPTGAEKAAYRSAFQLVKENQFEQAEKAFERFQKRYPQSKLAANAAYWQGEVQLLQKKYDEALNAFNTVITRYPQSLKVPDALLRKADTLVLMEKKEAAKKLYLALKKKYPKARAAQNVAKRLQILSEEEANETEEKSEK